MRKLFANPYVRLAARALVAGATVVVSGYLNTGNVSRALIVGGVLAFAEIFTPLNAIVGILKPKPPA